MKQYISFISVVTFFLITALPFPLQAETCSSYHHPVSVRVNINTGKVTYNNSLYSSQFPTKPPHTVTGLTVAQLTTNMTAKLYVQQNSNKTCVGLDELTINIGFPQINVYIDKKYRPGSCQYNVIKEHEKYHVRVQQEGLKFFSPKIKKAFQIAAKKVKPRPLKQNEQPQKVLNNMLAQIRKDVNPLLQYIERRLREENEVIDTKESYIETSKKCKKW